MKEIPLFDLNYDKAEIEAVTEVINSRWISSGPKCQEFEQLFCKSLKVKYACAVTNCTAALHLALCALGIGKGDEVLVPSLTFVATVNAVKYVGAVPVFCDVASTQDLTIDADAIKANITPRTKAVMVMHYAGFPCNMEKITEIAEENGLYIIEDACHGPLSEYKGMKLGSIGDIGCFSFFSNKNISTGEGGIVVTNNEELSKKVMLLRSHGMTSMSYDRAKGHSTGYDVVELGYNYRMDDIRAALAVSQLKKLPADLEKRKILRKMYLEKLESSPRIIIPFLENSEYVSNYIFPIILKDSNVQEREKIRRVLQEKGIQTSVHYPAVHRFKIYGKKEIAFTLPVTEYVSDCEISLPMYGNLSYEDLDYICITLKEVLGGKDS